MRKITTRSQAQAHTLAQAQGIKAWVSLFGTRSRTGVCLSCKGVIHIETFCCGLYVGKNKGGTHDAKNLIPVCQKCHDALNGRGIMDVAPHINTPGYLGTIKRAHEQQQKSQSLSQSQSQDNLWSKPFNGFNQSFDSNFWNNDPWTRGQSYGSSSGSGFDPGFRFSLNPTPGPGPVPAPAPSLWNNPISNSNTNTNPWNQGLALTQGPGHFNSSALTGPTTNPFNSTNPFFATQSAPGVDAWSFNFNTSSFWAKDPNAMDID